MSRILTYFAGRFYQVRAERAYQAHIRLKNKAEKFFRRLGIVLK